MGSNFEDYLRKEGQLEEATSLAAKQVLSMEIRRLMRSARVSQTELARRMKTSRAVIHRLLDAGDTSVTLATISRAAVALGKSVRLHIAS